MSALLKINFILLLINLVLYVTTGALGSLWAFMFSSMVTLVVLE